MINENVNKIFSSIAKKYDLMNALLTLNIDRIWRKKAISLCEIKDGLKIIDLCCGTGEMVKEIFKSKKENIFVIGLDYNEKMLELAYQKLSNVSNIGQFELVQGDASNTKYESSSFDVVTIAFGLRNIKNCEQALFEMNRILKKDGKLVCLELSKPENAIFSSIYNLYFNHLLPLIGYIGTGDKGAYKYLRNSVNHFKNKQELIQIFKKSGFSNVGCVPLAFGIAAIHYGSK